LHVESVAWVAERKDVLSSFFFLLCLHFYARYAKRRTDTHLAGAAASPYLSYSLCLLMFALGLMSKPMLVTTPFVLLLLDFWPLQRLSWPTTKQSRVKLSGLILEKIPFFLLSAISCLVTLRVQTEAMMDPTRVPLPDRLANATLSIFGYLKQAVWPANLAVFYPYPSSLSQVQVTVVSLGVAGVCIFVAVFANKQRYLPVGWLWYLGMLVPVIGLVQVGSQARADRYTYLPLLGIFILASWGINAVAETFRIPRTIRSALAGIVLIGLVFLTSRQLDYWKNSETLFTHATRVTQDNYVALECLGMVDLRKGDYPRAMQHLNQALASAKSPEAAGSVNYYLGAGLQLQNKPLEALPYLERAIVIPEIRPEAHYRLGLSLLEAGRLTEAEASLRQAADARPKNPEFKLGLAAALQKLARTNEAEHVFRDLAQARPDFVQAQVACADFLFTLRRPAEAESFYAAAVRLSPSKINLRLAYAEDLSAQNKFSEALREYEAAVKIAPDDVKANYRLAALLSQQGRNSEALRHYEKVLSARPDDITTLNDTAWMLATSAEENTRNGTRAVELAEHACKLTEWKVAVLMGTLAAAYAEAGRFSDAVSTAEKARDKARAEGQTELVETNEKLLALYRAGKPYHESRTTAP
jgi:tetratricopeptide (TPR) repeat protein